MKVRCDRADLVERLSAIQGIVPTNTTKAILNNFLLRTDGGNLIAEATDLKLGGRVLIQKVEVAEQGRLALPAARLLSILKEISEEAIEIHGLHESMGAELRSHHFQFKILGQDPAEFPQLEDVESAIAIEAQQDRLLEALRRVAIAASRDETRYHLNGVYFEIAKGRLTLTATDGKRMAHDHLRIDEQAGVEAAAIVPNLAIDVFQKVLASRVGSEEKVKLLLTETRIALETRDTRVTSALIEGQYPNYRIVFQPEMKVRARIKRQELLIAARSAALTADKLTHTVRFRFSRDGLAVESVAKEIGESRIEIPLELEGEPIEVSLNPSYVIDALRAFEEDELRVELFSPDKPVQVRGTGTYVHLVVPVVASTR